MENKDFEKIIREKLQQLESDFNPMHWEEMEHRLNTEAAPEGNMREQDSLDELVSDKLRNLEVSFTPSHWALMDEQLDAAFSNPEIDDVYLDGVAYDNLNNLNSPYNPDHWALMSKRLDDVFSIRHNVHRYKIIEVALLLFLIFTILPYLPTSSDSAEQQQSIHSIASILPANADNHGASFNNDSKESAVTAPTTAVQSSGSSEVAINDKNQASRLNKQAKTNGSAEPPVILPTPQAQEGPVATELSSINIIEQGNAPNASALGLTSLQSALLANYSRLSPFDPIDRKSMRLEEKEIDMPLGAFYLLQPKATRVRLGMMAAFDAYYTMTPYNDQHSSSAYNHFSTGYGGGISLGFGGKQWEVEVGLLYSSISYSPKFNVEINGTLSGGYYGEGLKAATLEVIKIPLNIHRSLGKIGKWQTSMLFGASANTALFTNYEFKKVPATTDPSLPPSPVPTGLSARPETHKGFLQGGSLLDNTYLTANVGLRVERDLSARWSVFIQPIYQHHLFSNPLGPNNDKISSGSVLFGMRANLKR